MQVTSLVTQAIQQFSETLALYNANFAQVAGCRASLTPICENEPLQGPTVLSSTPKYIYFPIFSTIRRQHVPRTYVDPLSERSRRSFFHRVPPPPSFFRFVFIPRTPSTRHSTGAIGAWSISLMIHGPCQTSFFFFLSLAFLVERWWFNVSCFCCAKVRASKDDTSSLNVSQTQDNRVVCSCDRTFAVSPILSIILLPRLRNSPGIILRD